MGMPGPKNAMEFSQTRPQALCGWCTSAGPGAYLGSYENWPIVGRTEGTTRNRGTNCTDRQLDRMNRPNQLCRGVSDSNARSATTRSFAVSSVPLIRVGHAVFVRCEEFATRRNSDPATAAGGDTLAVTNNPPLRDSSWRHPWDSDPWRVGRLQVRNRR